MGHLHMKNFGIHLKDPTKLRVPEKMDSEIKILKLNPKIGLKNKFFEYHSDFLLTLKLNVIYLTEEKIIWCPQNYTNPFI